MHWLVPHNQAKVDAIASFKQVDRSLDGHIQLASDNNACVRAWNLEYNKQLKKKKRKEKKKENMYV